MLESTSATEETQLQFIEEVVRIIDIPRYHCVRIRSGSAEFDARKPYLRHSGKEFGRLRHPVVHILCLVMFNLFCICSLSEWPEMDRC